MKKKISNLPLKKFFACCGLVLVLISICVPCFAVNVTVEANGWDDIGYSELISTNAPKNDYMAMNEGYFSEAQTETLIELAEEMYKANAFGGTRPVLITLTADDYNGWFVRFWCNSPLLDLPSYDTIYAVMGPSIEAYKLPVSFPQNYNNKLLIGYELRLNGSVSRMAQTTSIVVYEAQSIPSAVTNQVSWYYAYYNGNEWVYDENDLYCAVSEVVNDDYGLPVDEYQYALDQWKNANSGTKEVDNNVTIVRPQYVLDVPSIITAIPNGAKQLINNSFGFELFGINIAGLLSVLLIVAIVGFVVKWLMSR